MKLASKGVRLAVACATLSFACRGGAELKKDETVVFFDSAARLSADERHWIVPIHGWIYEPEDSTARKAAVAAALKARYRLAVTPESRPNFDRRVNLFFADNERGKRITLQLAGLRYELPASGPDGHFETELLLPRDVVEAQRGDGHTLIHRAVLGSGDARDFQGGTHAVARRGLSVISDIDDTVKITEVRDHGALLANTFFRDFRPVPGMAAKYAEWAEHGAAIHFVSSSPWQLYSPLTEFLEDAGFPAAVLHLKSVRLKDQTLLDLFEPGSKTKPRQIEPILAQFPDRKFVLVGDSGEEDPEVYAGLLRKLPDQIAGVYIRNITGASPRDERFSALFQGLPADRWALFTDPAELRLPELRSSRGG